MSINLVDSNGNKTGEVSREQFIRDYIDAKRAKNVENKTVQTNPPTRSSSVERKHLKNNAQCEGLMNGIIKMLNENNVSYRQESMKSVIVVMPDGKNYEIKIVEKRK